MVLKLECFKETVFHQYHKRETTKTKIMSCSFYFMYESTGLKEILPPLTGSMEEFRDTVGIFKGKPNRHVWKGKGQDLSYWQYLQTSPDIFE